MEDTHTGLVCRTGAPLVIGDISQDKRFTASSGLMAEGLCSILLVPLVARGVVVATFSVASRHSYAYGDRDRWALERLAPYISFAIENARLREEASQRDREIDVLATVQKNILELIAGDTPLIHVLEALCRFVEGQSGDVLCAIALPNPEEDGLDRGAAPSFHETFVDEMEALPLGPSWTPFGSALEASFSLVTASGPAGPLPSSPRSGRRWRPLRCSRGRPGAPTRWISS